MSHDFPNSDPADAAQARRLLARIADRLDATHERIARLDGAFGAAATSLDALARHATSLDATREASERLAELASRLEAIEAQLSTLDGALARLTRTQFKANTLVEAQEQRAAEAIAFLRDVVDSAHEHASDEERAAAVDLEAIRAGARAEIAADLLPSIDGIDNAIESGRALLARRGADAAAEAEQAHRGFLWRLTHREVRDGASLDRAALEGWLVGLELVRERFLLLLATEGIRPIAALGEPFDPHLHVAVGTGAGGAPGTVVDVVRAGYRRGASVLRFAEVIVARGESGETGERARNERPEEDV